VINWDAESLPKLSCFRLVRSSESDQHDAAQGKTSGDLISIKVATHEWPDHSKMQWHAISKAPFDRDLELAVIDAAGIHTLVFPCRRVLRGWVDAKTNASVHVHPTHWREWDDAVSPLSRSCAAS
jgi:hypothetical protein